MEFFELESRKRPTYLGQPLPEVVVTAPAPATGATGATGATNFGGTMLPTLLCTPYGNSSGTGCN